MRTPKHGRAIDESLTRRTEPVYVILPRLDITAGTGTLLNDLTGANRERFARSLVESLYKLYPDLKTMVDRVIGAAPDSVWPPMIGLDIPRWAVAEVEQHLRNGNASAESGGGTIG